MQFQTPLIKSGDIIKDKYDRSNEPFYAYVEIVCNELASVVIFNTALWIETEYALLVSTIFREDYE